MTLQRKSHEPASIVPAFIYDDVKWPYDMRRMKDSEALLVLVGSR